MNVERWCNRMIVVAGPDTGVRELARMMQEHDTGAVIIVREVGTLIAPIGIVTDRDLTIRALAADVDDVASLKACDVMSRSLLTIGENEELDEALARMRLRGVQRAPVVDEDGSVVAIVVLQDLCAAVTEMMASAMTGCQVGDSGGHLNRDNRPGWSLDFKVPEPRGSETVCSNDPGPGRLDVLDYARRTSLEFRSGSPRLK